MTSRMIMMPIEEVGRLRSADYRGHTMADTYEQHGRHLLADPSYQHDRRARMAAEGAPEEPAEIRGDEFLNGHNRYWIARDLGHTHLPVVRVRRASGQKLARYEHPPVLGKTPDASNEEVSKDRMAELLIAQGSDPEFLIQDEDEDDRHERAHDSASDTLVPRADCEQCVAEGLIETEGS